MKKSDLVSAVAKKSGFTKKDTAAWYDAFCDAVAEALVAGNDVSIAGVGKLKTVDVAERQGHNPQTGEPITIPAHKKVRFAVSADMKQSVK